MATVPVKYYSNLMQGAPQLGNNFGDLNALLDAVLVDGFNLKAVTSITRVGNLATLNVSGGLVTMAEHTVLVAGCDQAEYNGEFRVVAATSTSVSFNVTGTPATPATGAAITVKTAPLNFERQFTATNKRAFRSTNALSNKPVLWIDDGQDPLYTATYAKKGKVRICQAMSDINTVVGAQAPYDPANPTKGYAASGSGASVVDGWYKWYYARGAANAADTAAPPAGNRSWVIVGDDRGFFLSVEWYPGEAITYGRALYAFTDIDSYRAGDAFNTVLFATEAYNSASWIGLYAGSHGGDMAVYISTGKIMMRDYTQLIGPVSTGLASMAVSGSIPPYYSGYSGGIPYPNGPDYGLILNPMYVYNASSHLRGELPGAKFLPHGSNAVLGIADQTILDSVSGLPGRKVLILGGAGSSAVGSGGGLCRMAFDITGPWH